MTPIIRSVLDFATDRIQINLQRLFRRVAAEPLRIELNVEALSALTMADDVPALRGRQTTSRLLILRVSFTLPFDAGLAYD